MSPRKQGSAAALKSAPESAGRVVTLDHEGLLAAEQRRLSFARVEAAAAARALVRACGQATSPAELVAVAAEARAAAAEVWETASNVVLLSRLP